MDQSVRFGVFLGFRIGFGVFTVRNPTALVELEMFPKRMTPQLSWVQDILHRVATIVFLKPATTYIMNPEKRSNYMFFCLASGIDDPRET